MKKISKKFAVILRRGISLLLVVMMCASMFPAIGLTAHAETAFWSSLAEAPAAGEGTETSPYQITDGAELAYALSKNAYAILMNDIDLSSHDWLGNYKYSAVLDGNGKMISGLHLGTASSPYVPASSSSYTKIGGLVKQLTGVIKNLAVEVYLYIDGTFSENGLFVGGLVSECMGVIDGCTVTGNINVTTPKYMLFVGGIASELSDAEIRNCVNYANIRGENLAETTTANLRVGGIVGSVGIHGTDAPGGAISNCVNMGNVYAKSARTTGANNAAAGICVTIQTANVSNSYNAGLISVGGSSAFYDISNGGAKLRQNCYYWNTSSEKFVKEGDTSVAYATKTELLSALNENVNAADPNAGWLVWELGNNGYPIPGKDLLPQRLSGMLAIEGEARYGQTLTATLTGCNETNVTYQWRRSTETGFEAIANANGLAYTIAKEDIGHILQLIVSSKTYDNVLAVYTSTVRKIAGGAAPSVTGKDATSAAAKNGQLVGTTTAMEYSRFADFSTAYTCTNGQTKGLAPGVYYVRVKATATVDPSAYTQIVIQDLADPDKGKWTDSGNYSSTLSGSGTQSNPYLIKNAKDLAKLAKDFNTAAATAGKYFKITATEIDLSGHEWVPITTFSGILDGNNVKIRGLYIGREAFPADYTNAGLFGELTAGSVVKNLNINGTIYINSKKATKVGMITGLVGGTIDHCTVSGKINVVSTANVMAGGIAAQATVSTTEVRLTNLGSSVEIYVMGGTDNIMAAGIIGHVENRPADTTKMKMAYILNCYNTGNVSAGTVNDGSNKRAFVAGIVAWFRGQTLEQGRSISLHNCYNTGIPTVHSTGGGNANGPSLIDSIVGSTNAANRVDLGPSYSLTGITKDTDKASVHGTISGDSMSAAQMQSPDFAATLSINADRLVAKGYGDMYVWATTEDGTPVLTNNKATGNGRAIEVVGNSARLGSWKVEISAGGTGAYKTVGSVAMAEKGDKVRITFLPSTGCSVQAVEVNGLPTTITNNTYTFTINQDTDVKVIFAVTTTVDKAPIYVNPNAAPGGNGSMGAPFSTIQEAVNKAETMVASTPNANVTIYLMGGTHVLEETIRLDEAISSLGRVTFKNYNDQQVTVTSAHTINGSWTKVAGKNYYSYQLPGTAGSYPAFRDLLVNGTRAQLARTKDYTYRLNWENAVVNGSAVLSCDNLLYISTEALAGITNENLNGVELGQLMEWKSHIFHIDQITGVQKDTESQISFNQEEFERWVKEDANKFKLNNRVYWLQNHINFLDEPGEFYYDQSTGTIYYYPTSDVDITTAQIAYPTLEYLFELEDAANITFDGLTFTGTTVNYITQNGLIGQLGNTYMTPEQEKGDTTKNFPYAAIHGISNVEGVKVLNSVFTELGGSAMVFDYGIKDLTVTGNVMKDLAMAGVLVGRNQRYWNKDGVIGASEDIVITNNYITNIGLMVDCAPAIKVARCENLAIQHNTIIHVPYSGIMAGFGFNVLDSEAALKNLVNADISYNYIEDFLYRINDGGAIYVYGANAAIDRTDTFLEIHHNYIRGGAHNKTYTAVYHDASSSNWHTHHNVIEGIISNAGPMFFQDTIVSQYTHNITVSNNYTTGSKITSTATADRNIVLDSNIMLNNRTELQNLRESKAIMEGAGLEEAYAHIADPMDVFLQIQDGLIHFEITDEQESDPVMHVKVTNNYNIKKRFTLALVGTFPDIVSYTISGNNVELAPGASAEITITFVGDLENLYTVDDIVFGFTVTEDNGKVTEFPRQFTFSAARTSGTKVLYGKPVVDGYLDEAYLNSANVTLSTAVYFTQGPTSTSNSYGNIYLLWDEDYLYAYAVIRDATVMSRGIEYIDRIRATGNPNYLWQSDAIETYIWTNLQGGVETKFAVDAFGIQPFTSNGLTFGLVDELPYATKFTYEGQILEDYEIKEPTPGQTASTQGVNVNGYVAELTLPLKYCIDFDTIGQPTVGSLIRFYAQLNDYSGDYTDILETKPNLVCMRTGVAYLTLSDGHECVDADKNHKCDNCKAQVGKCGDTNKDHACDYGCDRKYSLHRDKDGDGNCEYCGQSMKADNGSLFTRIINAILDFFRSILALFGLKI